MDRLGEEQQVDINNNEEGNNDLYNDLYDLLDAQNMNNASSLHANVREANLPRNAFGADFVASGDNDGEFRNAASVLQNADTYRDVYRSVAAEDLGVQHQMGMDTQRWLDSPMHHMQGDSELGVPSPRIFQSIRLEHSHAYVACTLTDLIRKLDRMLNEAKNIDFSFDKKQVLYRCMMYPTAPSAAVDFRIYINSVPAQVGANRYLIELVRRNGCGMAFFNFFQTVQQKLMAQGVMRTEKGEKVASIEDLPTPFSREDTCWENKAESDASSFGAPLVLSRGSSADTDTDFEDEIACSDEELFEPLINMAKSKFEDVHVQGLGLLVHECKKGNTQRLVESFPSVLELLAERLTAGSCEVRRLAATALAEVAAINQQEFVESGAIVALVEAAATQYDPKTLEISRQAARALEYLAEHQRAAVLEAVEGKKHEFDELSKAGDERLTASIAKVAQTLAL